MEEAEAPSLASAFMLNHVIIMDIIVSVTLEMWDIKGLWKSYDPIL